MRLIIPMSSLKSIFMKCMYAHLNIEYVSISFHYFIINMHDLNHYICKYTDNLPFTGHICIVHILVHPKKNGSIQ